MSATAQVDALIATLRERYDDSFPRMRQLPELVNELQEPLHLELQPTRESGWLTLMRVPLTGLQQPLWVDKRSRVRAVCSHGLADVELRDARYRLVLRPEIFLPIRDAEMPSE